jgi:hypothetical protein
MFAFFRCPHPTRQSARLARNLNGRQLSLERLESRDVPTAVVTNQIVVITPTQGNQVVNATTTVTIDNNHTPANRFDDKVVVTRTTLDFTESLAFPLYGGIIIVGKGPHKLITGIEFHGGPGDDVFKNMTNIPATVYGGDGHDSLYAGSGGDNLVAGGGYDSLRCR